MFLDNLNKFKNIFSKDPIYVLLLVFCALLPFQFALNPKEGFDVAIVRIIIPLIFLYWAILRMKKSESLLYIDKISILIFIFLLFAVFSITFSSNYWWSLRKILFWLSIFPLFYVASSILNNFIKKRSAMFAFVIGATLLSWIAILQFFSQFIFGIDATLGFLTRNIMPVFLGNSFSQTVIAYPSLLVKTGNANYMRAVAIFPDPHMLSYYFGLLIPWALVLWSTAQKNKALLFISTLSLIIADILTFTRGGYLALIAGAVIVLPLVSKRVALKIFFGVILLFTAFLVVPNNPAVDRLASSFDSHEGSNEARISNWQQALVVIAKHPFGVGVGNYSLAVNPEAQYRQPIYAHNLYLDLTAELGLQTLVFFVLILLFAFWSFWVISKNEPFFIAGVSSLAVFVVHSLVENPMYSVHVLPLVLVIISLSITNYDYESSTKIQR